MEEIIKFIIGIIILALGFPIGRFISKIADDELISGQIWFKLLIIFSIIGAIIGLVIGEDYLFFSLLFIEIVTSQSFKIKKKKKKR